MNYSVYWNDYAHSHLLTAYEGNSIFEALASFYTYIYDELYDDSDFFLVKGDEDYSEKSLDDVDPINDDFFPFNDVLDDRLFKECYTDPDDFPVWDPQAIIDSLKGG